MHIKRTLAGPEFSNLFDWLNFIVITALQIQFDEPFPSRPYVTVSLNADNANTNTKISVFGIDQTGFKVSIYDTAVTTRRIEWIASV